jgi:hypothetical protein
MRITLNFYGNRQPDILLNAETDAEKAILAFVNEDANRRWRPHCSPGYRAGGIESVRLIVDEPKDEE